jgi:hypothetical protein
LKPFVPVSEIFAVALVPAVTEYWVASEARANVWSVALTVNVSGVVFVAAFAPPLVAEIVI